MLRKPQKKKKKEKKKTIGADTIKPKLIKIRADITAETLVLAIVCCLRQQIFPYKF